MKKRFLIAVMLLVTLMASAALVSADKKIDFGDPNFPTPMDPRNHVLIPNEVTTKVNETVRFQVHGFHQVLVYEVPDGTTLGDIAIGDDGIVRVNGEQILNTNVLDPLHAPPGFIHDHSDRFIAEGANPREYDIDVVDRDEGVSINLTFRIPGTYLVLCGVQPHFVNDGMFGIITVESRGGAN